MNFLRPTGEMYFAAMRGSCDVPVSPVRWRLCSYNLSIGLVSWLWLAHEKAAKSPDSMR